MRSACESAKCKWGGEVRAKKMRCRPINHVRLLPSGPDLVSGIWSHRETKVRQLLESQKLIALFCLPGRLYFYSMDGFLQRCLELARLPGAIVEPNPRVGAVVVYEGRIIGEGWHRQYGGPHAEVNAVQSVRERDLLPHATLYVSLEPCNHHGKTPPCTGLILQEKIPKVVVGSVDPNPKMSGQSIAFLREQGVEVEVNPQQGPFQELNAHFWLNQKQKRPWITLKWAESPDGFIAGFNEQGQAEPRAISQPQSSRWVHWLRHEHQAILVGKRTVQIDNPSLSTRKWPGHSPVRIFFDRKLEISPDATVYNGDRPVIVLNDLKDEQAGAVRFFRPQSDWNDLRSLMAELYSALGIGSILVEGGAHLSQQFLDQHLFDTVYRNIGIQELGTGLPAASFADARIPDGLWRSGQERIEKYLP